MGITEQHISRRDILKKSAAAGAVFWAVPVIESVTSRASAASGCEAAGNLTISGAAVVYKIGTTIYWTSVASGGTTCEATPTVPNDDDFGPVNECGAFVQVTGGTVKYGTTALNVATPAVNANCYFTATSNGLSVTPAGVSAGVVVLMWLFHNGTFPSACQTFGSKGHWALGCGSSNPNCGAVSSTCI